MKAICYDIAAIALALAVSTPALARTEEETWGRWNPKKSSRPAGLS
jgi:hypothetical protein